MTIPAGGDRRTGVTARPVRSCVALRAAAIVRSYPRDDGDL